MDARSYLKSDGAIVLGESVSCDGFAFDKPFRVQTHIHHDHMVDFDTSKANQHIVVSSETLALLKALYNADIPYRSNIRVISCGQSFACEEETVLLLPSHHMLGSVQVLVTHSDGYRVGYSSDFFWPVEDVIECDELVVDATYGDSLRSRNFSQQQAEDCLIKAVAESMARGLPTACIGHNGRLQSALHVVSDLISWPIICSPRAYPVASVYRDHGYAIPDVLLSTSPEAIALLKERHPCFAFVTLPEQRHLPWVSRMRKIVLSAYVSTIDHPLVKYSNGDCAISFTDHASFEGTLEYIRATGARRVLADPRSGNAQALATSVRDVLGLEASEIARHESASWG
jgi:putative mRNA 3-end processing factor